MGGLIGSYTRASENTKARKTAYFKAFMGRVSMPSFFGGTRLDNLIPKRKCKTHKRLDRCWRKKPLTV